MIAVRLLVPAARPAISPEAAVAVPAVEGAVGHPLAGVDDPDEELDQGPGAIP